MTVGRKILAVNLALLVLLVIVAVTGVGGMRVYSCKSAYILGVNGGLGGLRKQNFFETAKQPPHFSPPLFYSLLPGE